MERDVDGSGVFIVKPFERFQVKPFERFQAGIHEVPMLVVYCGRVINHTFIITDLIYKKINIGARKALRVAVIFSDESIFGVQSLPGLIFYLLNI